ncbi:hypothetical protein MTP04_24730 [Lysinibacillus sp. PLM2]|nr:hypothetical protein MTP04_24730 [Lysinibacillus sp. PLM2]
MNLVSIEKTLTDLTVQKVDLHKEFERKNNELTKKINDYKRLKELSLNNFDLNKITIAESLLEFSRGFNRKNNGPIRHAIDDIVNDFRCLRKEYFGTKDYSGFVNQEVQCTYGYGPRHGYVVFSVGLKNGVRQKEFTDEEKDACIYYLNHLLEDGKFTNIMKSKEEVK